MAGVYCPRCRCKVLLEQDGVSCSNCGRVLVAPVLEKPAAGVGRGAGPGRTLGK